MDERVLASTKVFLAGTLVEEPLCRTTSEGMTYVLSLRVDDDSHRRESVRVTGELADFVAETSFQVGEPLLILGALERSSDTDTENGAAIEYVTTAHRIARDDSAQWMARHGG
ncbi:hypothetical protein [Actinomyces howellii]|uniref:hypothetical protein n=1 Tax=Actinomyces howellii TaxID=52771 RepID=UPI000F82F739|nr:hypothetical protein [Actinomyces howellii]